MVANQVSAEEGSLAKGVQAASDAAAAIEGRARAMRAEGDGLKAIWRGEASTQYMALIDAWVTKTNQLVGSLRGLESGLRSTDQALAATESDNTSTIGNLRGMLG